MSDSKTKKISSASASASAPEASAASASASAFRDPIVSLSRRNPEEWTELDHFCLVLPPVYKEGKTRTNVSAYEANDRRDDGPLFCLLTFEELNTFLTEKYKKDEQSFQVTLFSRLRKKCLNGSWKKHRIASHEQIVRGVAVIGIRDLHAHFLNLPQLRRGRLVAKDSIGLETFKKYRNSFTVRSYPLRPDGTYDENRYNQTWGPNESIIPTNAITRPSLTCRRRF